jgi:septal ring factor EnvC (AmiA/AmiB activator)
MTTVQFFLGEQFRRLCCSSCGILYFFPEKWCDKAADEKTSWQCPNGHGQKFRTSEKEELRQERDRLKQRVAEKDDEIAEQRRMREETERSLVATKGHVTRVKKRAAAGTCPCCQRTFSNMAEHMKRQHPKFVEESGAVVVPLKKVGA